MKERLPEPLVWVFVSLKYGSKSTAYLSCAGMSGKWRPNDKEIEPTHWMPIPELPKPDPFEEWWAVHAPEQAMMNPRVLCRDAWNAALEHAKKQNN